MTPAGPWRPTITLLARRLGVSTATVSLALNDHPRVSARTRERVKRLARRLNYTPDLLARGLVTRRAGVLGLVVADIANGYFARLARRVEDAARERGFGLVIASTDEDPAREARVLEMMLQRRVDGLILTSTASSARPLRGSTHAAVPLVLLGRLPAGARADSVSMDNRRGGYLAARHLLETGRRRIAMITGPRGLSDARGRLEGYVQALAEAGLAANGAFVVDGDFSEASGFQGMRRLLGQWPRPDAVVVQNNLMLIGAMRAVRELGLSIPDDLAVVGFDEVEWSDIVEPPITMVEQPVAAMGQLAVELLLRRIEGDRTRAQRLVVEPVLRIRRSCGAAPSRSDAEPTLAASLAGGGDKE